MNLNQEQKALLEILKYDLFNIKPVFPKDVNWYELYGELKSQGILGISEKSRKYIEDSGLYQVNETNSDSLLETWKNRILVNKIHFNVYTKIQNEVIKLLNENSINYCVLKGTVASYFYPVCENRLLGDIDILVKEKDFQKTDELLASNGFSCIDKANARHNSYMKNGVEIEVHKRFCETSKDGINNKIESCFTKAIDNPTVMTVNNASFNSLPKFEIGLLFLVHMRHHIYHGVGFRHFCDWMLYVNDYLNDDVWESEFKAITEQTHLDGFAKVVTRTAQIYCGLSEENNKWCLDANQELCDKFIDYIFYNGNHGRKHKDNSRNVTTFQNFKKLGVFRTLQKSGELCWNALKKYPKLKPFAWLYSIYRYIKLSIISKNSPKKILLSLMKRKEIDSLFKDSGMK